MTLDGPLFLYYFLPFVLGVFFLCPRAGRVWVLLGASLVYFFLADAAGMGRGLLRRMRFLCCLASSPRPMPARVAGGSAARTAAAVPRRHRADISRLDNRKVHNRGMLIENAVGCKLKSLESGLTIL